MLDFEGTANRLGKLLVEKNTQYGNSYIIVPNIMRELYPNGIPVELYGDALTIVRILDKLCRRAANNPDAIEDWRDIGGYGILKQAELEANELKPIFEAYDKENKAICKISCAKNLQEARDVVLNYLSIAIKEVKFTEHDRSNGEE